jgi:hypothetical protein
MANTVHSGRAAAPGAAGGLPRVGRDTLYDLWGLMVLEWILGRGSSLDQPTQAFRPDARCMHSMAMASGEDGDHNLWVRI